MSTPDDDALTWAGDPDRETTNITWSAPKAGKASSPRSLSRPRGGRIETPSRTDARSSSGGAAAVSRRKSDGFDTPTASATQPAISANVELIVTAAFAAAYLLVTVAWLIVALRNPLAIADPLGNAMFVLGLWAAVAAGPLACGGVIVLGRHLSLARRSALFILGIVVLIPWPYLGWAS
jgi:hypothetical protein